MPCLCSQPPALLFPVCHWDSHGSTGPSSHERRESQVLFPELPWGVRGAELWPSFPPPFRGGPRAEPGPRAQDTAQVWGQHVALPPPSSQPPCKDFPVPPDSETPPVLLSSIPQGCQGVDAALGTGLSLQPSHNPSVLHPRPGSPEALPMLIWVCF